VSGIFVGGTDTDCGKTQVGCALARAAVAAAWTVRVLKPIETGCLERQGERVATDARALAAAAGDARPADAVCPYRLALPAAPAVAADAEGVDLELAMIRKAYADAEASGDVVLVEAAGGLRVPLWRGFDMLDLAAELGLPLVLVCRARLGTLNHTLLSVGEAERRGVPLAGLIVSHTEPELSPADRANLDWLLASPPVPFLGELAHAAQVIRRPDAAPLDPRQVWPAMTNARH